ncbi:actin-like ATPase domain-containing protein [Xylaria cubensis]|nr:actin-like ATPase domain-containing protein [Xylaria cubensis]
MASARGKSTLVIGIDFGTTYTGVSWLFFKENAPAREPEVVTHWLSALSKNNDRNKVPSRIHYDEETGEIKWGYNIPTDIQPIQWFKLLLLDEKDLPANLQDSSHIQAARNMMEKLGKTAVELVGDYLKVLWEHVISEIQDEKGTSLIRGTRYHVVLSVPAIWKDYARDRMSQAAERAGILEDRAAGKTTLGFISEPEAAALATLPELDNRDDLAVGDSFVVMDAGGGTVDIISYKVEKLEPMVVSECVEGDGALCGATFVDSAFEALMEQRVGRKSWKCMEVSAIKKMMNNEWEHGIKKDFDGSQEKYCIDLPKRNKRGQVIVEAAEIQKVFEKVLSQTYDMLQQQLDGIESRSQKPPKFVILVGGFGRCPFLFRSLKKKFKDKTDILQARGEKPWSAICRGATLSGAMGHGLTEQVVKVHTRVARLSYGWTFSSVFNPSIHDTRDKYFCDISGEWRASCQMEWIIKRVCRISYRS